MCNAFPLPLPPHNGAGVCLYPTGSSLPSDDNRLSVLSYLPRSLARSLAQVLDYRLVKKSPRAQWVTSVGDMTYLRVNCKFQLEFRQQLTAELPYVSVPPKIALTLITTQ